MKVNKFFNFATLIMFLVLASSCTSSGPKEQATQENEPTEAAAPAGESSCLIGEWTYTSASENLLYVFNADNSGYEDIGNEESTRPFSWELKGDKVSIIYDGNTQEWELGIDCENGILTVFGLQYTKK